MRDRQPVNQVRHIRRISNMCSGYTCGHLAGILGGAPAMIGTANSKPSGVVGVRELREDASAVIAEVEKGNWFLVSKRGNPVGVLLPSAMAEELLMKNASETLTLQLHRGKKPPR